MFTKHLLYRLSYTSTILEQQTDTMCHRVCLRLVELTTRKGLEPSTSSVTGWHSNQLNYRAIFTESKDSPVKVTHRGIEPLLPP